MACDAETPTRHWFGECRTCQWCDKCDYFTKGCEVGAHCTSGCKTKDHYSYADCLQSKSVRVAYCDSVNGRDATRQKKWDGELDAYRSVRKQGIQPDGTTMKKINEAVRLSDAAGAAYGRDFSKAEPMEG